MSSCTSLSVRLRPIRKIFCINYWGTSDLSPRCFTEVPCMGGKPLIFTLDVTRKVPLSPYLRSKEATAQVDIPQLSGNQLKKVNLFMIKMRCFSTFRKNSIFPIKKLAMRYGSTDRWDPALESDNLVHRKSHLMESKIAYLRETHLIIRI